MLIYKSEFYNYYKMLLLKVLSIILFLDYIYCFCEKGQTLSICQNYSLTPRGYSGTDCVYNINNISEKGYLLCCYIKSGNSTGSCTSPNYEIKKVQIN